MTTALKQCSECKMVKPITKFYTTNSRSGGFYTRKQCRACIRYRINQKLRPEEFADDEPDNPVLPEPYRTEYAHESRIRMQALIGPMLEKYGDMLREKMTTPTKHQQPHSVPDGLDD